MGHHNQVDTNSEGHGYDLGAAHTKHGRHVIFETVELGLGSGVGLGYFNGEYVL